MPGKKNRGLGDRFCLLVTLVEYFTKRREKNLRSINQPKKLPFALFLSVLTVPLEPISSVTAEDNQTKEASPATATRQSGFGSAFGEEID